jgi:hypothetical protein
MVRVYAPPGQISELTGEKGNFSPRFVFRGRDGLRAVPNSISCPIPVRLCRERVAADNVSASSGF